MKRGRGGQFWIDRFFLYGSHLWCFEKNSTCCAVNTTWRKVIRKGLGMSTHDSVSERRATWFVEANEKLKREQLMFIHQSLQVQMR